MTPAFSPGPWITHGPLVGSVRRWTLEDLYEQCSFHMAEKMPSSVSVGSRPMQIEDALVLVGLEAVLGDQFGGDVGFVRDHSSGSLLQIDIHHDKPGETARARRCTPIAGSTWFSGCGIMPSTLPRSLTMPAMALMAPLTFQAGSSVPAGEQ